MTYVPTNLLANLNVARQAMMAQQSGLNVVGQNVANVNTEGYSRKQLVLEAQPNNSGVTAAGIRRFVDEFAQTRLIEEETLLGFANQKTEVLSHVSELFNDLQDTGIGAALDNFFGALRTLESDPANVTSREEVLARAEELSSAFNRVAGELESVRRGNDDRLRAATIEINSRTEEIAYLNNQIAKAETLGMDTSDYRDRRDQLVREISEYADIHVTESSDGTYTVFLEGGMPLVEGKNQSTLYVNPTAPPGAADVEYISPDGKSTVITSRIRGGRMGGALEARDVDIPAYQAALDQVAYDLITAFNAQHAAGYGQDGVTGRLLFAAPSAVTGAAANMAVSSDVAGQPANVAAAGNPAALLGDNENAIAMANLPEQLLASGNTLTFNEAYGHLVGTVGVDTRRASDTAAIRTHTVENVERIRDSRSGVAMDEELTFMIAYQRAYQASAKVISTTDQLLQSVLAMKG